MAKLSTGRIGRPQRTSSKMWFCRADVGCKALGSSDAASEQPEADGLPATEKERLAELSKHRSSNWRV